MKLLNESPCDEVPHNHFRNTIHSVKYDDIFEFNLIPAKTIDWNTLSQYPVYVELHEKFVSMNWMGIVQYENVQVSKSMVQEFLTGIILDKKGILLEDRFAQNRKFLSDDEEEEAQKTQSSGEEKSSEEQDTEKEESENDIEETGEEENSDDEVDEEIEAESESKEVELNESSVSDSSFSDSAELGSFILKTKRARTKHADKDDTPTKKSKRA
ncbi:hypothetical protein COLO4_24401 [Corchorus olitorius]|uniref:Uncharacterized protein n=1 Tax=Corchorus olitorius TaxID=93759 RepID=A0A1R3IAD7_9ROSI|nr:hypothetical protein COLO4_24401 [Corchorus olitorius]